MALPGDFTIDEDGGELFLALALDRRPTAALAPLRREIEQVGVKTQAGDNADMIADGGEKFDGRERAVGDEDNRAIGEPAVDLQGGLAGPIEQRLGRARFAGIEALGRGEQSEEGERHDAIGPRHAHEQHGGKPAQAAGFDEVPLGGADRIAIDAAGADLGSPAPLDGVINADHDRPVLRYEHLDQQDQQLARPGAGRPGCAIEDTMEGAEVGIAIPPQNTQRRRDGAPAGRQDDAGEQYQNVRPGRAREQIGEPREPGQESLRQRRTRRAGEKMGVLHPIGRIGALNRGNLAIVRQIESAGASSLACASRNGHIDPHDESRPDPHPDRGSVHAARRGKERRRLHDCRPPHLESYRSAASHSKHRSLRALLLVKRQRSVDHLRKPRTHEAHARERS